jgi:hypothetical protein
MSADIAPHTIDSGAALASKLDELHIDKIPKEDIDTVIKHPIIPFVDHDINDLDNATEPWWATGDHIIAAHLLDEVDENVKKCNPLCCPFTVPY